ncbi:hypothetical protein BKA82DRAFT_1001519 [Pisolithus tinctorius]|uniref:Uncharacterized protein n=1 Tax=Pisolithus tinctorius Marx 270 TaxID=870435 RepID=A0A0C3K0X5_PISTI|nr:hypothetical protein BKA82DRAFT_1001519 [Pisolithus tinctorius]KIO03242.1 hypothetical protein M404DRAFT_1001519 [Pisolithus tinctorius Marx 270]
MTSVALVPAIAYGLCMDDQFPSFRNDRLFIIDLAAEASPISDEHLDINDTPLGCIIISSYQLERTGWIIDESVRFAKGSHQVGMCGPHTILPVHRLVFPNGAEL